jgi:hypothetical protein
VGKHAIGRGTNDGEVPWAQCLGDGGILIPSRQVWDWTHAVLGITWMPGETEMIKMANLMGFLTLPFAQVTEAIQRRAGKATNLIKSS